MTRCGHCAHFLSTVMVHSPTHGHSRGAAPSGTSWSCDGQSQHVDYISVIHLIHDLHPDPPDPGVDDAGGVLLSITLMVHVLTSREHDDTMWSLC